MQRCHGWLNRIISGSVIFILIVVLSGCIATQRTIKPELMNENGLVVARFTTNQIGGLVFNANAKINGRIYAGAVENSRLMLQLKPGKYTLESVSSRSRGQSVLSMGMNFRKYTTTTTRIAKEFDVQAGRVTNIGVIVVYLMDKEGKKGKIFYVNNDRDAQSWLLNKYPAVHAQLESNDFIPSKAKYLTMAQIQKLRYHLIAKEINENKRFGWKLKEQRKGQYAASILGTLCKFKKNSTGKITNIELIETGTFERIETVASTSNRFACIVPNTGAGQVLFITENNKIVRKPVSNIKNISGLTLFGDAGVILTNKSLFIQTSVDNGSSWEDYAESVLEKDLPKYERVQVTAGQNGYYIYSTHTDSTLLYRDDKNSSGFKKIAPPHPKYEFHGISENKLGIFTWPSYTEWKKSNYYFLPVGTAHWKKYECPDTGCVSIMAYDNMLEMNCWGRTWQSTDVGMSWKELPKNPN